MNINVSNRLFSGTVSGIQYQPVQFPLLELINNFTVVAPSSNLSPVYIGASGLTVANSVPLYAAGGISLSIDRSDLLWCISPSGWNNSISYIGS
jgi:hypothetical protein